MQALMQALIAGRRPTNPGYYQHQQIKDDHARSYKLK
jgi:hypothetical protein